MNTEIKLNLENVEKKVEELDQELEKEKENSKTKLDELESFNTDLIEEKANDKEQIKQLLKKSKDYDDMAFDVKNIFQIYGNQ